MTLVLAQALAEKGALDSAITGLSYYMSNAFYTIEDKPWILLVIAVVLFLVLKKKR